jgi:dCMP deaminase
MNKAVNRSLEAEMSEERKVLQWVPQTKKSVLEKMHPHKLDPNYVRPSHLDTFAKEAIVISQRSTCMWYEVGAVIFDSRRNVLLATGYNGAARGDVDPRKAGCARVVNGKLQEGKGLCRGSHAELNAIAHFDGAMASSDYVELLVTLHPCYTCAKQIANINIRKVWYLWEYGREEWVTDYLQESGVAVERYRSNHLQDFVERIGYYPIGSMHPRLG